MIQIIHIKDMTDALWGCQDKPSCSPRLSFWSPNSPDLNPLDYYVWSVVERVTNKSRHLNMTLLRTAIETVFVGMGSVTLQRAFERFKPRIEAVIQIKIYRIIVLYRDPPNKRKVPCKKIFCNINFSLKTFSLKTFCLKKLFDLFEFWWRILYIAGRTTLWM